MSSAQFFAFVEGGLDRPFYERVVAKANEGRSVRQQVIAVREVPGSAGGKVALLDLFKRYRKAGHLSATAFGKRLVCVFFADKDCDDACRRRLRSPHLIYTISYDLEGYLYQCGDLHRALADACGLTGQQSASLLGDSSNWIKTIVANWKAWTALCMLSQAQRVNSGSTYDRVSAINPAPLAAHDSALLTQHKAALARALGLSPVAIEKLYRRYERLVETSLSSDVPFRYFKGKWLAHLLQKHLEASPRIPDASTNAVGEKVITALIAQVAANGHCKCCAPYMTKVQQLSASLM